MLAIFQAGGAYLPLSPFHPASQLSLVLAQSHASLVLTTASFQPQLAQAVSALSTVPPPQLLLTDLLATSEQSLPEGRPLPGVEPANLAYVIYTSGSTGEPKGAMIEQRGMINHLCAKIDDLQLGPTDTVAQNVAQSFDVSVWQFLAALLAGGRVQIISERVGRDPLALFQHAERYQVTILETVPSLLQGLFHFLQSQQRDLPLLGSLRWLISTGEALSPELATRWLSAYPQIPLMNGYGPTECSDDVSHGVCSLPPADGPATVPIGRAIANLGLHVLDATYAPVPPGRSGELYIGGAGVGRGYLHSPQLTADRFLPDPFGQEPGARLYRSGDLVRTLPDGNLEFLGRIDTQVKVRGYRIELSEIEAALNSQKGVEQSVVLLREDQPAQPRLVAYLMVPGETRPGRAELVTALRECIPEYMIPSVFLFLDTFPLTAHGKIHRRALPAPVVQRPQFTGHVTTATDSTAGRLAALCSQELGAEEIGMQSNFLALGGNSLSAIRVLARIKEVFQIEISLRTLFTASTLAEIVAHIDDALCRKGSRHDVSPY
jgi:amino acid adenylation domain-containing protein